MVSVPVMYVTNANYSASLRLILAMAIMRSAALVMEALIRAYVECLVGPGSLGI